MDNLYDIILFLHVMSFVFMSVPLFNLIVVNERALLGVNFNYYADRYMENIIRHGASRCFVFQSSVFVTGILLLIFGDLGIAELWSSWVMLAKVILLFALMGMLSFIHFRLQPKIEEHMSTVGPDSDIPDDFVVGIGQDSHHFDKKRRLFSHPDFYWPRWLDIGLRPGNQGR